MVGPIPTTSVARTLVDNAARWSTRQLGGRLDDALVRKLVTIEQIRAVGSRLGPAPARRMRRYRSVAARRGAEAVAAESVPETRLQRLIVDAGFPPAVQQCRIVTAGRTYRADLAYPELRLALEYLGFDPHRTRTAFDRDHRRHRDLAAAGWTVLYFTSADTDADIVAAVSTFVLSAPVSGDRATSADGQRTVTHGLVVPAPVSGDRRDKRVTGSTGRSMS